MSLTLVTRAQALALSPALAHAVLSLQAAHDPRLGGLYAAGDRVWLEAEGAAQVLDADMAEHLNAELIAAHDDRCDPRIPHAAAAPFVEMLILRSHAGASGTLAADNAAGWQALSARMGWGRTIILGGFDIPLFRSDPDLFRANGALDVLVAHGIGAGFRGGIVADGADLRAVLAALFEIVRLDGSAPTVHLAGEHAISSASLCQYYAFHIDGYGKSESGSIRSLAASCGFGFIPFGDCALLEAGAPIEGRTMGFQAS